LKTSGSRKAAHAPVLSGWVNGAASRGRGGVKRESEGGFEGAEMAMCAGAKYAVMDIRAVREGWAWVLGYADEAERSGGEPACLMFLLAGQHAGRRQKFRSVSR